MWMVHVSPSQSVFVVETHTIGDKTAKLASSTLAGVSKSEESTKIV